MSDVFSPNFPEPINGKELYYVYIELCKVKVNNDGTQFHIVNEDTNYQINPTNLEMMFLDEEEASLKYYIKKREQLIHEISLRKQKYRELEDKYGYLQDLYPENFI